MEVQGRSVRARNSVRRLTWAALIVVLAWLTSAYDLDGKVMRELRAFHHPFDNLVGFGVLLCPVAFIFGALKLHRRTVDRKAYERALAVSEQSYQQRVQSVTQIINDPSMISMLYQPIVNILTGSICGFEALSRFPGDRGTEAWFEEADKLGFLEQLEVTALRRALACAPNMVSSSYLSINVSPKTLLAVDILAELEDTSLDHIVLELTEQIRIDDYYQYRALLARLRNRGIKIAVDDFGAGYASLRHLLRLSPDIIKLDKSLADEFPDGEACRAIIQFMVGFASLAECDLIVEGIETRRQLSALREIGVTHAQGFLLGVPQLAVPPRAVEDELYLVDLRTTP